MNTRSYCVALLIVVAMAGTGHAGSYVIVDTGQTACYDNAGNVIAPPSAGQTFYGQDAQTVRHAFSYVVNPGGTVTDETTGLTWAQSTGEKITWDGAVAGAAGSTLGDYDDWRLPTIKELYSLINFDGVGATAQAASTPFIDADTFDFQYGDTSAGERFIDCQYWSATKYTSTTMNNDATVFGVNFADGRIKGYPQYEPGTNETVGQEMYALYVRGNTGYGVNKFVDTGGGAIADNATSLMWAQADSGVGMNWQAALAWAQQANTENYLGHSDWRLPDAKELQSIVDYTRSPDATDSAAIDPIFSVTELADGEYGYFWTSTTHLDGPADIQGSGAVYVAFGEAMGYMEMPPGSGNRQLVDVHGAGAQRSDPKSGDPDDYPFGRGPQGDVIGINNFVRLVRSFTPGDTTGNGFVDDNDLSILLANWTATGGGDGTWITGDLDGDGAVADNDLSVLLANWTGAPSGIPVPEPGTLTMIVLGAAALIRRRRGQELP